MVQQKKYDISPIYVPNKELNLTDWLPPISRNTTKIKTNSWFTIEKCSNKNSNTIKKYSKITPIIPPESIKQQNKSIRLIKARNPKSTKKPEFICSKKVRIYPLNGQHLVLQNWFDLFTKMYNITTEYIRSLIYKGSKLITIREARKVLNFNAVRKILYNQKITLASPYKNNIPVHILDEAIKLSISNHKTCLTNLAEKNIKKFRVRCWPKNHNKKILIIEANFFKESTFCSTTFDNIVSSELFNDIDRTVILQYNQDTRKYILMVQHSIKEKTLKKNKLSCGGDLGVRSFLTVYSEDHTLNICPDIKLNKDIVKWHKKIDKIHKIMNFSNPNQKIMVGTKINGNKVHYIKNKRVRRSKLRRALRKYHKKINNKVRNMHFKVSHHLVNSFDNINIGKFNTKQILSRHNQKITPTTKRMIGVLQPYRFRQVLKYMGNKYATTVTEESEYLTTKTCSHCGKVNEIGASETYYCPKCKLETGRDENAAKNILKSRI